MRVNVWKSNLFVVDMCSNSSRNLNSDWRFLDRTKLLKCEYYECFLEQVVSCLYILTQPVLEVLEKQGYYTNAFKSNFPWESK